MPCSSTHAPALVVARHKIRDCIALVGTDIYHHWRLYWKTLCKLIEPGVSRTAFANQGCTARRKAGDASLLLLLLLG